MMRELHVQGKISWPDGYRMAVVLYFDYQGGEGVQLLPEGNVHFEDYTAAEYGPQTGIWRLLRILEEEGMTATFLTCGAIAERYPETVKAILSKGHDLAGHGFHHETARNLSRDEEQKVIQRTIEAHRTISGKHPAGWRSCTQSPNTLELLMEEGFLWNSNTFTHDLPYIYVKDNKKIVELPRQPFGDGLLYGHKNSGNPRDALFVWKAAFDELYEESKAAPTYCPFTFHPYVSSRPGRARTLRELIHYMKEHEGVWFTTGQELAKWCLKRIVD